MLRKKFPFYRQPDTMDCGPTCLRIIAKYHGLTISLQKLRLLSESAKYGNSFAHISKSAEEIGFKTLGVKVSFKKFVKDAPLPCIAFWKKNHFVVIYKIKNHKVFVADPAYGLIKYSTEEFIENWIYENTDDPTREGVLLLLEPTERLRYTRTDSLIYNHSFKFLAKYFSRYKKLLLQLVSGLIASVILQFIPPFLTKIIIDLGIQHKNLHVIYLVLAAQVFLFLGSVSIDFIRGWLILHIGGRVSIELVSDFVIKLIKLPISFFDTRTPGDIIRRIHDNHRIKELLTTAPLNVLFSLFHLLTFGVVLAWYNLQLLLIFLIGSLLYVVWAMLFLKQRRELDYKQFSHSSEEHSKTIELINGIHDIKMHNAEDKKRWELEYFQACLFKINAKRLKLEQIQSVGGRFINELKNILMTFLAAIAVIDGQITLGTLMSVSYIIGQINGPVEQFITVMHTLQDAEISLARLTEIHSLKETRYSEKAVTTSMLHNRGLTLKNVSFCYKGCDTAILKNIDLFIPNNKLTAIVGMSGSGKTTLMKLLLKFYPVEQGEIYLGPFNLNQISAKTWRACCGVVMQEGYIFNDTITNNIALGDDTVNQDKLLRAVEVANIKAYIEQLPLRYNTKIGGEGRDISVGQKQRLLIARAVYNNPKYLFFDEATSSLDASNEQTIMQNLSELFSGRLAVVIAHRLSTVKSADNIIVLDRGSISEQGTHQELIAKRGSYYHLVKNQLARDRLYNT